MLLLVTMTVIINLLYVFYNKEVIQCKWSLKEL